MNKLNKNNLILIESRFKSVQKNIDKKLNSLNKKPFQRSAENWNRKLGGGGKSISINGDVIEKAAVNFSSISGSKLPASSLANKSKLNSSSRFHAVGVSIISHPFNPYCPTSHMNIRIFLEIGKNSTINNWWIGGGFDLTPYMISNQDSSLWHNEAKLILDEFSKTYYKKFAKNCDEYFFLPHRKEKRGIGGIFFDQLNNLEYDICKSFALDCAATFIQSYSKLFNEKKNLKFTKKERAFQLHRRGRYVEFNLLYDRGTKFGLMTNGNPDAIFMSLPPSASW